MYIEEIILIKNISAFVKYHNFMELLKAAQYTYSVALQRIIKLYVLETRGPVVTRHNHTVVCERITYILSTYVDTVVQQY